MKTYKKVTWVKTEYSKYLKANRRLAGIFETIKNYISDGQTEDKIVEFIETRFDTGKNVILVEFDKNRGRVIDINCLGQKTTFLSIL